MRIFIGVFMPEKAREKIKKIQKELERQKLFVGGFTKPENLHLTLKFLGEIGGDKLEEVKQRLRNIMSKKINASLNYGGVFTDRKIKIIWIKLNGFDFLQREIDQLLSKDGLFNPDRRFMSHLTIARIKSCRREDREKILEEVKKIKINYDFGVNEFCLVKSVLKPQGAEYKILERFKLN